jgi:hypothetical protein
MPSSALKQWQSRAARVLDEVESAHAAVGGAGAGRRFAAQQVNHAYVVMLCSQFQRFCRDLHTECVNVLTAPSIVADPRLPILRTALLAGRKLDTGNPNPGNVGSDFGRFELELWARVRASNINAVRLHQALDDLCAVRNAVAHQDFDPRRLRGRQTVRLADVRRWRRSCDGLAIALDGLLGGHLAGIIGRRPW